MKRMMLFSALIGSILLSGCAKEVPYDYSAFKESNPRSVLVMMPTDETNEVKAGPAVLAQAVMPLSEAGYYVFPVALVNETFKRNGLTQAQEIQNVKATKLQEIFGADTALYLNVKEYGVNYQVFDSVTRVVVQGKLVDLRSGKTLLTRQAEGTDSNNNNNGNAIAALIVAAVKQIVNQISDKGYQVAGIADARLLATGTNGALLYGPYHPNYGKDPQLNKK